MRLVRLLPLVAFVALLLVFGAAYDVPEPAPPRLSTEELAWLADARPWLAAPSARRCVSPVPAEAPTDRLDRIRGDFVDACGEADPVRALAKSRAARRELVAQLLDRRPLMRSDQLIAASRVEPRLGRALTALAGGRPVSVRCWSQAHWQVILREEAALTGAPAVRDWLWLPRERALQLQSIHCGPLVELARGEQPSSRPRRVDTAIALWLVSGAAESVAGRRCVGPAGLATTLGVSARYAVALAAWARTELGPVLPPLSRRCTTSRPS